MRTFEMEMTNEKTMTNGAKFKTENFRRTQSFAFCPRCEKPVDLMFFDEAAAFYKTRIETVAAIAERGKLHRLHNNRGEILICGNSLFNEFTQRETEKLDVKMLPRLN